MGLSGGWAAENAQTAPKQDLPRPDGKEADMSKPVQVCILLGQSNMVGMGKIAGDKDGTLEYAVKTKKKYSYLVDDAGNWTERKDVRFVRVMGSGTGPMRQFNNEWMTVKGGTIAPMGLKKAFSYHSRNSSVRSPSPKCMAERTCRSDSRHCPSNFRISGRTWGWFRKATQPSSGSRREESRTASSVPTAQRSVTYAMI
jgi:hypothetical protein